MILIKWSTKSKSSLVDLNIKLSKIKNLLSIQISRCYNIDNLLPQDLIHRFPIEISEIYQSSFSKSQRSDLISIHQYKCISVFK